LPTHPHQPCASLILNLTHIPRFFSLCISAISPSRTRLLRHSRSNFASEFISCPRQLIIPAPSRVVVTNHCCHHPTPGLPDLSSYIACAPARPQVSPDLISLSISSPHIVSRPTKLPNSNQTPNQSSSPHLSQCLSKPPPTRASASPSSPTLVSATTSALPSKPQTPSHLAPPKSSARRPHLRHRPLTSPSRQHPPSHGVLMEANRTEPASGPLLARA